MIECKRCVFDHTVPNLKISENGDCQYCKIHDEMEKEYPKSLQDEKKIFEIAKIIKNKSKNKKYNCVIGISGGRDSSYLLYFVKKKLNLKPLAVHYDNGFDSDTSVTNILEVCKNLDVDLETVVEDWDSFKKITRSFFLAGVSDPDTPTDIGIFKSMYKVAYREKIPYVFNGHSFRTEGVEPLDWTYMDGKYVKDIHSKFGDGNIDKFNNFTIYDLLKFNIFGRIKTILPLNYISYNYKHVEEVLEKELGWRYYGGHHHESLLTKFVVSVYLPNKFNIDRRRTSLAAMVRSNKISRKEAMNILKEKPKVENEEELVNYILEKLEISPEQYNQILKKKNVNFRDFNSYYNFFKYFNKPAYYAYKLGFIPKLLYLRYYGDKI